MDSELGDIKTVLSKVETNLNMTTERINRIANALPDVKVRVAQEEISNPIKTAIVTTQSGKDLTNRWISLVHIFDHNNYLRKTYLIRHNEKYDNSSYYTMIGIAASSEPNFVPLQSLSKYSQLCKKPYPIPEYVNGEMSFILRETLAEEYIKKLKDSNIIGTPIEVKNFSSRIYSYEDLIEELKNNSELYKFKK